MDAISAGVESPITAREVFSVMWRRLWVVAVIFAACLATAGLVSLRTAPAWRGSAQLILVQRAQPVAAERAQTAGSRDMVESVATQVQMLKSYESARRTIELLKNEALEGKVPADATERLDPWLLQEDIEVASSDKTSLMDVQVAAPSRERARLLTDAVCRAFVNWKSEVAQQSAAENVTTLEDRVKTARAQLDSAEQREIEFKRSRRMADVPTVSNATLQKYLVLDEEFLKAQQEVRIEQAKLDGLSAALRVANRAIETGTGVRDDALVIGLQQTLASLEAQRAEAALKYRPSYQGEGNLKDFDSRIRDIRQRLANALKNTLDNKRPSLQSQGSLAQQTMEQRLAVQNARAKLNSAQAARAQVQKQAAGLPDVHLAFARINRDKQLAEQLYTSLQASLNAARIERDTASGNVQISQLAVAPDRPFKPNHALNLGFGAVIAVILSLFAILLLEQTDRRLRSVEDVRRMLGGQVVGSLPTLSASDMQELMDGSARSLAEESYSLARANLALMVPLNGDGIGRKTQVLLVTSAFPGEGKSLTAAQMAKSLARAGNSVILVDADMRRPTQNLLFGTDEPIGLADVLTDKMSLREALVSSGIENLSILHSGAPDRNPSELMSTPRLLQLIHDLRQEAQVVVLDAPACAIVADALLLAPHADCVLHVVAAGLSEAQAVRDATAALAAASPQGIVYFVNRAPHTRSGSYSYYAAYRYKAQTQQRARTPALIENSAVETEGDARHDH